MEDKNKISVVLPAGQFERFNSYCTEKGFKKSSLIVRLIREHMDEEGYRTQRTLPLAADQVHDVNTREVRRPAGQKGR